MVDRKNINRDTLHIESTTYLAADINESHRRFIEVASEEIVRNVKALFPQSKTPGGTKIRWIIEEKEVPMLKNLVMRSLDQSITSEDSRLFIQGAKLKMDELNRMSDELKKKSWEFDADLKILEGRISKLSDDELHGE